MKKTKLLSLAAAALLAVSPIASFSTSAAQTVQASKKANLKKTYKNHTLISGNGSRIHLSKIVKYNANYMTEQGQEDTQKPKHSTDLMIYGIFHNNGKKTVTDMANYFINSGILTIFPNTKKYQHYLNGYAKVMKKVTPSNAEKYHLNKWGDKGDRYNIMFNDRDSSQIINVNDKLATIEGLDDTEKKVSYADLLGASANKYKNLKVKPHQTKSFCIVLNDYDNTNHQSFIFAKHDYYQGDYDQYSNYKKCFTMKVSENKNADLVSLANRLAKPYGEDAIISWNL